MANIMMPGIATLSIITVTIMGFIVTFSMNDSHRNIVGFILSVAFFIVMLSVIMLTVAALNVIASMFGAYYLSFQ